VWIIVAMILSVLLPNALSAAFSTAAAAVTGSTTVVESIVNPGVASGGIAPLFTSRVDRWAADIMRWSVQYGLDPNLLATVMQIESCGNADVTSHAGAQGLFQVMPFHFAPGEVYTDPETNAKRSANFLNECLGWANGDAGLALACYNGGPSVTTRPFSTWHNETQRYYNWGTGIYADAQQNLAQSPTLMNWLQAGGSNLCGGME
jgi:soluble lytic murein transglycosylase-like protein